MPYVMFCATALFLDLFIVAAEAKWKPQYADTDPVIAQWYRGLSSKAGGFCCDQSDGHDFFGDYKLHSDGSVEFDAIGAHFHIEADYVVNVANPTGHAVWFYNDYGRGRITYCFVPGAGG